MDRPFDKNNSLVQQPILNLNPQPQRPPALKPLQLFRWAQRPKFATCFWEEESTFCYQVDANSICVARRQGTHAWTFFIKKPDLLFLLRQ
jgi:hypothetical protein